MYQYQFGVVTKVCRRDGMMDLMEFKDGEPVVTGKVFFFFKDGQFFTPGRRQPMLSGSRFKERDSLKTKRLPRPNIGQVIMFVGTETRSGFLVASSWGYYRDWRRLRNQMRRKRQTNRINQVKIGFEKLVTAPVK